MVEGGGYPDGTHFTRSQIPLEARVIAVADTFDALTSNRSYRKGISPDQTDFVSIADHTVLVTTSNFAAIADAYGIVKVVVQDGYDKPIHTVVNRVRSPEEAEQVFLKLKGCTERFLGFDLNWLGLLPEDTSVEGAVLKRTPFSEAFPGSVAARYLAKLVSDLERFVGAPKPVPQAAQD